MKKEIAKRLIALFLCLFIVLPSLGDVLKFAVYLMPKVVTYASDYVENDKDKDMGVTYYTVEGTAVKDLFDFTLKTVFEKGAALSWALTFKTFTVIAKTKSGDYTFYFNTPNVQHLLKNNVIDIVEDGYSGQTYDIYENEKLVKVGSHAKEENAITKYGFKIGNNQYDGEYPVEVMSVAGIVPSSFWGAIWSFIKSLFGFSFINAPDADNFNTITYLNHGYMDKDTWLVEFFGKYFLKYFVNNICKAEYRGDYYFKDEADYIERRDKFGTEENAKAAKAFIEDSNNTQKYNEICASITAYEEEYTNNADNGYIDWVQSNRITNRTLTGNSFIDLGSATPTIQALADKGKETSLRYKNTWTNTIVNNSTKSSVITAAYGSVPEYNDLDSIYGAYNAIVDNMWINYTHTTSETTKKITYDNTSPTGSGITLHNWHYEGETTILATNSNDTITINGIAYHKNDDVPQGDTTEVYVSKKRSEITSLPASGYEITFGETSSADDTSYTRYTVSDVANTLGNRAWYFYFQWKDTDFITEEDKKFKKEYEDKKAISDAYDSFKEIYERGDEIDDNDNTSHNIFYRQCLIESEDDDACYSKKYGNEKVTIAVDDLYIRSGLYKLLDTLDKKSSKDAGWEMTEADANRIIQTIKSYCGPYGNEVITNIIKLICLKGFAQMDFGPYILSIATSHDPRIMPYDISTMTEDDKENYTVVDPRVKIYKSTFLGELVVDLIPNPFNLFRLFTPQTKVIDLGGQITEYSVFMQQLCTFEFLDSYDLSPANMWTGSWIGFLLGGLALYFIVKTVIGILKMGTQHGKKAIVGLLVLVLELGIFTAFAANPTKMWESIKNISNNIISFGNRAGPLHKDSLSYLYGSADDTTVMYYLPYLDLWSKYNTGYGILRSEQEIDTSKNLPETKQLEDTITHIDGQDIGHYSVLLMDALSYYGESKSPSNSIYADGAFRNGELINNNAYRVVDHFLAPRIHIDENGNKLTLSTTENENYNGDFQDGFLNLIAKFLNCCLGCFLSFIKMLVFFWQWFMFYILIFKILLGKVAENKSGGQIFLEVVSPLIGLVAIGLYTNICLSIGMLASEGDTLITSLIGIIIILLLFKITIHALIWWSNMKVIFPRTLKYPVMLFKAIQRHRQGFASERKMRKEALEDEYDEKHSPYQIADEVKNDPDKYASVFYYDDGTMKPTIGEDDSKVRQREIYNRKLKRKYVENRGIIDKFTELEKRIWERNPEIFNENAVKDSKRNDALTEEERLNNPFSGESLRHLVYQDKKEKLSKKQTKHNKDADKAYKYKKKAEKLDEKYHKKSNKK